MKILVVEDDGFKEEAISDLIEEHVSAPHFVVQRSVQTAVECILDSPPFDLIILDVALPSHDRTKGAGNPASMPSGGIEVLLHLNRLGRRDAVVIVTQYPEVGIWGELVELPLVVERLRSTMKINLLGLVHYDEGTAAWRSALSTLLLSQYD